MKPSQKCCSWCHFYKCPRTRWRCCKLTQAGRCLLGKYQDILKIRWKMEKTRSAKIMWSSVQFVGMWGKQVLQSFSGKFLWWTHESGEYQVPGTSKLNKHNVHQPGYCLPLTPQAPRLLTETHPLQTTTEQWLAASFEKVVRICSMMPSVEPITREQICNPALLL